MRSCARPASAPTAFLPSRRATIEVYLPDAVTPIARQGIGDIVGEYGMFLPGGRSATLRASGPTSVLTLDYEHFKRFLLAFPQSMLSLLGQLVNRTHASQVASHPWPGHLGDY